MSSEITRKPGPVPKLRTRTMGLRVKKTLLYESSFDPDTGHLVRRTQPFERTVEHPGGWSSTEDLIPYDIQTRLRKTYPRRYKQAPSPSPELVDVSITDKCGFGCTFCYQDSKPELKHADPSLISTMLKGFQVVPYQIAIGGGEPTGHPDLPEILYEARSLGTVPNYTTAGHIFRPEVIEATNAYCGGIAITYHAFRGLDWFKTTYTRWKRALKIQINIHLIADKDVAKNLEQLIQFQLESKDRFNVVLLAYYPDTGRANMDLLMTRTVYTQHLPEVLRKALLAKMGIAFSEGLLPYFLSRPEIGVNTDFATKSEGIYSCYVSSKGGLFASSFESQTLRESDPTVFTERSQTLWEQLSTSYGSTGAACYSCKHQHRCSAPRDAHLFACAYQSHNALPLQTKTSMYDHLVEDEKS